MRPDFILHLPDNNDIVIDAKVSLSAFSDYVESEDADVRAGAARRNAEAVREQAKRLARKGYERYLRPGRRMLDYVVMFVPNYPALQLAYNEDPSLWRDAYAKGVLITSEETLMPFLRMISIAWTHVEQVRNQQQIIASAQMMIDRVADFAKAHAEMGNKLKDAQECYDRCADKLKDSGRSIVQSARQIVKLGVPKNKHKTPLCERGFTFTEIPSFGRSFGRSGGGLGGGSRSSRHGRSLRLRGGFGYLLDLRLALDTHELQVVGEVTGGESDDQQEDQPA